MLTLLVVLTLAAIIALVAMMVIIFVRLGKVIEKVSHLEQRMGSLEAKVTTRVDGLARGLPDAVLQRIRNLITWLWYGEHRGLPGLRQAEELVPAPEDPPMEPSEYEHTDPAPAPEGYTHYTTVPSASPPSNDGEWRPPRERRVRTHPSGPDPLSDTTDPSGLPVLGPVLYHELSDHLGETGQHPVVRPHDPV